MPGLNLISAIKEAKAKHNAECCFIFAQAKAHSKLIIESLNLDMHTFCVKTIACDQEEFRKIMNSIRDGFDSEKIWDEQHLEDQLIIHLKAKFENMRIERQQSAPSGGRVDILIEG